MDAVVGQLTMQDWKLENQQYRTKNTWVENAGLENEGPTADVFQPRHIV